MKITKGLTWPFLVLALLTTFIFMAGLAALQASCNGMGGFPGGVLTRGTADPNAAFGMSDGYNNCHKVFRFYWFTFAFVTATLLGLLIAAATHMGLHFSRPFWVGMITISTLLMMIASEAFLGMDKLYDSGDSSYTWLARMRTATAGAIMSVVSLIGLLMAVGTDWERTSGMSRRDEKFTGRTTTTEQVAVPVQNVRVVDQV